LEELRLRLSRNSEGADAAMRRAEIKAQALRAIDLKLERLESRKADCANREAAEEAARQAAAVLPSPEVLDKIMRYETTLQRQLYRAMNQLERIMKVLMMPACGKTNPSWHKPTQRPVGLHPIANCPCAAYRPTGNGKAKTNERIWWSLMIHFVFDLCFIMSPSDRGTPSNERVSLASAAGRRAGDGARRSAVC
jgi:hypothetical protein